MLKAYYFLWRREGMNRAEFVDYYEEIHADLIIDNLPPASDFRRNYLGWVANDAGAVGVRPFDVLTAITYPSDEHFGAAMHAYHSPPFSEIVTEDELRFVSRDLVRFQPVEELIDHAPGEWFAAPKACAKLLRLTRRPAGIDQGEFRRLYEAEEASRVRSQVAGCIDYRRNYVLSSHPLCSITPDLEAEIASHGFVTCDLIEEFCFPDSNAATEAARRLDEDGALAGSFAGAARTRAIEIDQRIRAAAETIMT